jgi:hypothetical protein
LGNFPVPLNDEIQMVAILKIFPPKNLSNLNRKTKPKMSRISCKTALINPNEIAHSSQIERAIKQNYTMHNFLTTLYNYNLQNAKIADLCDLLCLYFFSLFRFGATLCEIEMFFFEVDVLIEVLKVVAWETGGWSQFQFLDFDRIWKNTCFWITFQN